jgi:hypothetical protein
MRRIRSPCCARAATGHAAAVPPSSVMNWRLPIQNVIWSRQPEGLQLNDSTIVGACIHVLKLQLAFGTMMICGSLRLEAREPYYLAPLLGFVRDELAEVDGRERKRRDAQNGKLRPELGIG